MRCWVRCPRAPTCGLSENGARRTALAGSAVSTASTASTGGGLRLSADLVFQRVDRRRCVLPTRDAVFFERDREPVVVQLRPVRVVELVQREAGVERVVE